MSWLTHKYTTARRRLEDWRRAFTEPSNPLLLPPLLPEHHYVRTLVLDLEDVLVHSDWNRQRGWRTFKRPGAERFLEHMSQYFEVVVYTDRLQTYGEPIMERLDPKRCVAHRLYRDATNYVDGVHARDLGRLNRELRKVLYVTADSKSSMLYPDNALVIRGWDRMDPQDTTLLDLMPFLESIVRFNMPDTRDVVRSYRQEQEESGKDPPEIFRDRMERYKQRLRDKSESRPKVLGRFGSPFHRHSTN